MKNLLPFLVAGEIVIGVVLVGLGASRADWVLTGIGASVALLHSFELFLVRK